jgi:hypothetical protein
MELKVALAMIARMFNITPAYDQWDELHPKEGIKSVEGNRVNQSEMGGGEPILRMAFQSGSR